MGLITDKLLRMGIVLPDDPPRPIANYVPAVTVNNLVFTSGTGCRVNGKPLYEGKLGSDLSLEQGRQAARIAVINSLAALQIHLGDLDRMGGVVKLTGFVNSAPGFHGQYSVLDGASRLLEEIFGGAGRHARTALASPDLPMNNPISIEMIVMLRYAT